MLRSRQCQCAKSRSPSAPASVRATQPTCISTLTRDAADRESKGVPTLALPVNPRTGPNSAIKVDLTIRLSDAGMRRRKAKLIYFNHRLPPWPTEDATPRSLEPGVRLPRDACIEAASHQR